jgi:opacity protein-like surface antigen
MKIRHSALALTAVALGAVAHSPLVQAQGISQEVEVYGGAAFGDDLVDKPAAGRAIQLDDAAKFGTRYTIYPHERFGLQLAAGAAPARIRYAQGGDVDVDVYTVDANLLVNLTPQLQVGGHKLSTYAVIGAGYAWADADDAIVGVVGSTPATLDDDGGFTANAGLGAKLFLSDAVYVGLDARYRYIDKLLKTDGKELNTVETTLSVGFRF